MSLKAEVILEWGDGEYVFSLKGKEIEELEHLTAVGFGAIYQRVQLGTWMWKDLYHSIRLGLIGGGMGAVEAKRLTDMYITQPLVSGPNSPESVAMAILGATMVGVETLVDLGEPEGGAKPPRKSTSQRTARRSSETE